MHPVQFGTRLIPYKPFRTREEEVRPLPLPLQTAGNTIQTLMDGLRKNDPHIGSNDGVLVTFQPVQKTPQSPPYIYVCVQEVGQVTEPKGIRRQTFATLGVPLSQEGGLTDDQRAKFTRDLRKIIALGRLYNERRVIKARWNPPQLK